LDVLTQRGRSEQTPHARPVRHVRLRYSREIIITLTAYERAICASVSPLPRRPTSFLALMVSQLGLPAEADARSKRPGPAFSRPLLLMSSAEHRDGKGPTTLVFRPSTSRAGATEVRTVADVSRG